MQPSMFNLRVPLAAREDVFLMNTLTDAQLVVSRDVADLLDRTAGGFTGAAATAEEREALTLLRENGFLVDSRAADRQALDTYLASVKGDSSELNITLLTTLQCNFACDYCNQGDHGAHGTPAGRMSLEQAVEQIKIATRQLARRQMKWFRRFKNVRWLAGDQPIEQLVNDVAASLSPRASP